MTGPHTHDGGHTFHRGVVFPIADDPTEDTEAHPKETGSARNAVLGWIFFVAFVTACAIAARYGASNAFPY
jgi:hypothetical protein